MSDEPDDEYYGDDESSEPIGCCDECECDIFEADCYEVDDLRLCNHCAWIALGCPEPGESVED